MTTALSPFELAQGRQAALNYRTRPPMALRLTVSPCHKPTSNGHPKPAPKPKSDLDDIASEIAALKRRRQQLLKLKALRSEVLELETCDLTCAEDTRQTVRRIIRTICAEFKVTQALLGSARRSEAVCTPRMLIFYLCREFTSLSYAAIGKIFERQHDTVMHGCNRIKDLLTTDHDLSAKTLKIIKQIKKSAKSSD